MRRCLKFTLPFSSLFLPLRTRLVFAVMALNVVAVVVVVLLLFLSGHFYSLKNDFFG